MEWIKTEDQLPKFLQECLFTHIDIKRPDGSIMEPHVNSGFHFHHGKFKSWLDPRDEMNATHWMPLPLPPKE